MKKTLKLVLFILIVFPITVRAENVADYIQNIAKEADGDSTSVDVIGETGLAYDNTIDNNLRYVGESPNNYVLFNNELWRIIGVFNNVIDSEGTSTTRVKIIRNESLGIYSWDSTSRSINGGEGINQWGESSLTDGTRYEGSDIMIELNGDYLNTNLSENTKWINSSNNEKNTDFNYNNVLSIDSQKMIESVLWYTGVANDNRIGSYGSVSDLLIADIYANERLNNPHSIQNGMYYINSTDKVIRTSTWIGKVALAYLSDYGYSIAGNSEITREECFNIDIYNWESPWKKNCGASSWMFKNNETEIGSYVIDPNADNNYGTRAYIVRKNGGLFQNKAYVSGLIFPSVYLNNEVYISSGDGSINNPYILKLPKKSEIEIINDDTNGDVNFQLDNLVLVPEGTHIKFNISPKNGLIVSNIQIIDSNGNRIEYLQTENEYEYTFVMPESDVTITPVYEKIKDVLPIPDTQKYINYTIYIVFGLLLLSGITFIIINKKNKIE